MELVDLSFIIAVAERSRDMEREYCVLLNKDTYMRLLRNLQIEWECTLSSALMPKGATFEYYGRTISWTPALDNFPEGYAIGEVWRGQK